LASTTKLYNRFHRDRVRDDLGISPDTTVILYIGRISPISKCDLLPLFRLFARISETHPQIQLIIGGDDTQHDMAGFLETAAKMLGTDGRLRIFPNINNDEKIRLLTAADVFVSPSDNTQETFGLTIVEAMASGLPVIASDWNGYRELVTNSETGFLIPTYWLPLDEDLDRLASTSFVLRNAMLASSPIVDPDELAHHLILLIEQPELRHTLGQGGRRRARERYDWSVVIKAYEDIWNDGFAKSRMLRKGRSHSANCPPHYQYQQIFSHHPSHMLRDTEVVAITNDGKRAIEANADSELTISPNGTIDLESVRRLLESAGDLGPTSITELAERFTTDTGRSRLSAFTTIAFSLKYGFLKLRDPRT
jgi:hypothetical protein